MLHSASSIITAAAVAIALPGALAHFTLQTPQTIGFVDLDEHKAPCGGFDINNRDKVTDFPTAGHPIGIISTHPGAVWEIRAALSNETDKEGRLLLPRVRQAGLGAFCWASIQAPAEWAGLDGVIQVSQTAVDGKLFQCAAVKFTDGASAAISRDSCRNTTGTSASFVAEGDNGDASNTEQKPSAAGRAISTALGPGVMAILASTLSRLGWMFL